MVRLLPLLAPSLVTVAGFDLAGASRWGEQWLNQSLAAPWPISLAVVSFLGLLTSFGPCSLSLLPVTMAFLAGTGSGRLSPWRRSSAFATGVVATLTGLGLLSSLMGRIYGQIPGLVVALVAALALVMGLNLLGLLPMAWPAGPTGHWIERRVSRIPPALVPMAAGLAFGLAASPCTTPVLAVLLAWIGSAGRPLLGAVLLAGFGLGQVFPLLLVGTAAASLPRLLALRAWTQWIPRLSGAVLVSIGGILLLSQLPMLS